MLLLRNNNLAAYRLTRSIMIKDMIAYTIYWYYKGAEIAKLYDFQAWAFGDNNKFTTILVKTIFDQFVYNTVWGIWTMVPFYKWVSNGYDYHKTKQQVFSKEFIYMDAPKLLFSIWMIWIPMVTLIYSLPSSVQIPFWSIIMIGSALPHFFNHKMYNQNMKLKLTHK